MSARRKEKVAAAKVKAAAAATAKAAALKAASDDAFAEWARERLRASLNRMA